MAYTTINKPEDYFKAVLYTGTHASVPTVTVGFKSDFLWLKSRTQTYDHALFDTTRGGTKYIASNSNSAESTSGNSVTFNATTFQPSGQAINEAGQGADNMISWNWKCNGGTTSSNSDGSVTSTVQANTTSGFSIVTYTATGSGDITVGHGLGVAPDMILTKTRSVSYDWRVFINTPNAGGAGKALQLDGTAALSTNNSYPSPAPTSTVMTMGRGGDDNNNYANGETLVSYCFKSIQGYSKMGNYTGNGETNGSFVYTGFKPAWILTKPIAATGNWNLNDNARNLFNVVNKRLRANGSNTETDSDAFDFLSNGFKIKNSGTAYNQNNYKYFYMAFAENPLVATNGVPATAR